jgi:hypothetical protein
LIVNSLEPVRISLRRLTAMALRLRFSSSAILGVALLTISAAGQEVRVGATAPAFTATDSRGQT